MQLTSILFLVLSSIVIGLSASKPDGRRRVVTWRKPLLPEIRQVTEVKSDQARFHGRLIRRLDTTCGVECQRMKSTQPHNKDQWETELGFETLNMEGMVVIKSNVEVGHIPKDLLHNYNQTELTQVTAELENTDDEEQILRRRKRRVFGVDTRFALSSRKSITSYPFSTAVKISTGCSGILISPKHVLTSAHCIHDGKRYIKGIRKLKVGKQMPKVQKQRRGRRGKGKKGRKNKRRSKSKNGIQKEKSRSKRDLSLIREPITPYFKWVRAKKTHVPQGWIRPSTSGRGSELPIEYDYAVIELRKSLGDDFMEIGVSPSINVLPSGLRIHFTGFDSDRKDEMLFRFCSIEEESPDLMYNYCDAQEGTSGSGIYIRLYDSETGQWSRKVIGVFSGHQWVDFADGSQKEFNTGVRITPLKYAQICFWTKGSYDECRGG